MHQELSLHAGSHAPIYDPRISTGSFHAITKNICNAVVAEFDVGTVMILLEIQYWTVRSCLEAPAGTFGSRHGVPSQEIHLSQPLVLRILSMCSLLSLSLYGPIKQEL
jgi:hypothetical protein